MTTTLTADALPQLAERINQEHRACEAALNTGLQHALEAGRLLIEAKEQVKHGDWGQWIKDNCECSDRTARAYMRVAHGLPRLEGKRQRAADLSFRDAVKLLAEPEKASREKVFHTLEYWQGRIHKLLPEAKRWIKALHDPKLSLSFDDWASVVPKLREATEVLNNYRLQYLLEGRRVGLEFATWGADGHDMEEIISLAQSLEGSPGPKLYRRLRREAEFLARMDEADIIGWAQEIMGEGGEVSFGGIWRAVACGEVAIMEKSE